MKVKKFEKFQNKMGLKTCRWSSLNAPGIESPQSHSYWERGNSPNSQYGWDWGVSVPGAFKLDHVQPFKPILFWNFSNFFTFILGSQFLLPQRANNGKREILPTSNIGDSGGFQCLGPSNWTTCSPLSQFHSEHFQTFSLSYWGAHSYYPRG